jgi:uncharacterized protein (TIGR03790 family)
MKISRILISLAGLFAGPAICLAELLPAEIAIVAMRGSRESEGLAAYYARVRQVPAENICLVDMPRGETISREQWRWAVRPAIRKWLAEKDPNEKLRCLVTVWDVPLRIAPGPADEQLKTYQAFLQAERAQRLKLLQDIAAQLDRLGGSQPAAEKSAAAPSSPAAPAGEGESESAQLQKKLEAALQQAQSRIGKMPPGDERNGGNVRLQQLITAVGGANVILNALNQQTASNDEAKAAIRSDKDRIGGRASAYIEMRAIMEQTPPSIERDVVVLAMLERITGLIGSVEWLDEQLANAQKNETGASFDSELSLVMWPDDYQLLRWQPNYLRPGFDNSQLRKFRRTLMVARIDAPTIQLAKGLVDTAMQVEQAGLRGKVYIDARGLGKLEEPNVAPGSYADFDRGLLATAKGIKEQTKLEVVLDTGPSLFQPGQCKDAALYCGWYSLSKYVDAFEWKPGAVAYHLASAEATTLRDPASQAWCKRLLEDGVCATIGPVYEPYLIAFPRPEEFFALLLQGDLTLVECYYRTQPFNSWMMTLIGDPLYRPFKTGKP